MKEDVGNDKIPDAYDVHGRPLYYHPPEVDGAETVDGDVSQPAHQPNKALVKLRHDRSVNEFLGQGVDFDEDEYVEVSVQRHQVGLALIWIGEAVTSIALVALWIMLMVADSLPIMFDGTSKFYISIVGASLLALLFLSGWIGSKIYKNNRLIVTNKRVIQKIANGLFDRTVQTIDLASIEDVSFKQVGIIQTILDYGTVRLATVGDETTYQMTFVMDPDAQVKEISRVVHDVKDRNKK